MMKTTALTIKLSSIALETLEQPSQPTDILQRVERFLNKQLDHMGQFIRCDQIENRSLGTDLQVEAYDLQYEKRTLRFQFAFFQPSGIWQVQGFRFV